MISNGFTILRHKAKSVDADITHQIVCSNSSSLDRDFAGSGIREEGNEGINVPVKSSKCSDEVRCKRGLR
jgi:hypothetical protein